VSGPLEWTGDPGERALEFKYIALCLLAALKKHGVHDGSCLAHRVIGRFGSRSGMRWNESHDLTTCTCSLGAAIRRATIAKPTGGTP
jgi:hypothetical protein